MHRLAATFLFLVAMHPAFAITLTFDEMPHQSIQGLNFSGVTFGFKVNGVDSADAYYNSDTIGDLTNLQNSVLEGDAAGALSLDFSKPTTMLGFGVALRNFGSFDLGFSVELFDSAFNSLGITSLPTESQVSFTEAYFNYVGTPVSRASITFDDTIASRFAVDNLSFIIPAPPSIFLLGIGLVAWGFVQYRKVINKPHANQLKFVDISKNSAVRQDQHERVDVNS